ncbi:LOW QUALITY PROTEIN: uncharacterized protein ACR2FA_004016 [Aphomia sociella]
MAQHYITFSMILFAFFILDIAARPSNNELTTPIISEEPTGSLETIDNADKEKKSLSYSDTQDGTKDILNKIKVVNAALKKPNRRQQINFNGEPQTGGGYILNKDVLEKLQQIIASGKLQPLSEIQNYQESNYINNEDALRYPYSKSLHYFPKSVQPTPPLPSLPIPYITNIPVLVMPSFNNIPNTHGNNIMSTELNGHYQTRQQSPFPFQWPLASYFPVLIKDPLLGILQGGGWNNFVEYGQNADICSRKQKSTEEKIEDEGLIFSDINNESNNDILNKINDNSREGRALKKHSTPKSTVDDDINTLKKAQKLFSIKPTTNTPKPVKQQSTTVEIPQNSKIGSFLDDGDFRFNQFSMFGDKKPLAPSPGFFINRLKVRRGGVAIAGPGGVATAGRGGAAIVGPGGLAYTQPGGLAVAGPAARVVALSPDSNLSSIVARLQELSSSNGSVPRYLEAIPEGKVVATGPVVYYHPTFYRRREWRKFEGEYRNIKGVYRDIKGVYRNYQKHGFSKRSDDYQYNGTNFVKEPLKTQNSTFTLIVKPIAHAIGGVGVAIANPISRVVIAHNKLGSIVHAPIAAAIVGPGGIAHAQSDLHLYEYYLPFYGGGKGQYLEIKKDTSGRIISENIVPEDKISTDSIVKNNDETLVSKVLAANLQNLKTLSASVMKLHNLGRRTGSLGRADKEMFKSQLEKLAEAASNTIKLIDELGGNVDMLFKSNATQRRFQYDEEDVGEEGIGIDAPTDNDPEEILGGSIIAEAKPVGLAIIGENGLAASRPIGTAVAATGVALARPIATAVAGIDPTALGINFHINHSKN